ncbi:glycosyltransferase family 2 protein [Halomonas sp. BLK-85]
MKIAVIIPSYKPSWYLDRCLFSLENQSLSKDKFKIYIALNGPKGDYEVFVLNLLAKYSFTHEYLYIEEAGVSYARNRLIDISKEEYITFIDDDDIISERFLEQLLHNVSADHISVSDVANFTDSIDNLTDNYIGKSFATLKDTETSLFKARKYFSSPCAKLIPREIVGSTRFDLKLKVGEDSLFMAELSKRVQGISKTDSSACYYVYQREGSASREKVVRMEEIKRVSYLVATYGTMLFNGSNLLFIFSRIAASMKHLRRIF